MFAVPGPLSGTFDGLPWSTPLEGGIAILLALALISARTRRRVVGLADTGQWKFRPLPWVLFGIAALKLVAFVVAPSSGFFEACYRGTEWESQRRCTVSFENPWQRHDVTRFDRRLDFEPQSPQASTAVGSTWDLGHMNDTDFNVFELDASAIDFVRFPFDARWTANVTVGRSGSVDFAYVGEGRARLGSIVIELPPAYDAVALVSVPVTPGRYDFTLDYAFTSIVRGGEVAEGPYATLNVTGIAVVGPPVMIVLLTSLVDLVLGLVALLAAVALVRSLRSAVYPMGIAAGAWVSARLLVSVGVFPELVRDLVPTTGLVAALIVVATLYRWPSATLAAGSTSVVLVAWERVMDWTGSWDRVLYRSRGDDWLTYQSFARTMLAEGPIRGGEDVFYYQPGFRYLLYAARLVAGDSDAMVAFVQVGALAGLGIAMSWVVARCTTDLWLRMAGGVFGASVLIFATSNYVVERAVQGLSEIPTWIGIVCIGLAFLDRRPFRRTVCLALAAALILTIRPNQGFAMITVLAIAAALLWVDRPVYWRTAGVVSALVFVVIALSPLVHNLWFGRTFVPISTNSSTALDLPVSRLARVFSDEEVRSTLIEKAQGLTNFGTPRPEVKFATLSPLLGFQVTWLAAVVWMVRRRGWQWRSPVMWLIAAWPFAYAISYITFDVWNYYPRHIVAFNLALAVSGLVIVGRSTRAVMSAAAPPERHDPYPTTAT